MAAHNKLDDGKEVVAKYANQGGAEVIVYKRETEGPYDDPAGWLCKGCQTGLTNRSIDSAQGFADNHAGRCRAMPLN